MIVSGRFLQSPNASHPFLLFFGDASRETLSVSLFDYFVKDERKVFHRRMAHGRKSLFHLSCFFLVFGMIVLAWTIVIPRGGGGACQVPRPAPGGTPAGGGL